MANRRAGERGFSLVEVLVAMAIAALAMVALYRTVLQSATATSTMEERLAATVLAQSLLDDVIQSPLAGSLARDGREGRLAWKLTADRAEPAVAALAPRGFVLYDVTVRVTWAPRGALELSTLSLGR